MNDNKPDMVKPALIGGIAAAVASNIPGLNLLNCLCCSLVIGGGVLAAYLYAQTCRPLGIPFSPPEGAKLGALAGLFGGVVSWVLGIIVVLLFGDVMTKMLAGIMERANLLPPEVKAQMQAQGFTVAKAIMNLVIVLVVNVGFGAGGGALGGHFFKVEPPPASPENPPFSPTQPPFPPAPPSADTQN